MKYKIGQIMKGSITGIQPYGAFVSLDEHTQGLIHVSEIQAGYTKNIHQFLKIGQKVIVQIIDIDEYTQKISLSLRTLKEDVPVVAFRRKRYFTNRNKTIGFHSLEKKLPQWISEASSYLLKEKTEK